MMGLKSSYIQKRAPLTLLLVEGLSDLVGNESLLTMVLESGVDLLLE
jgi:hypothetical protein